jgi:ubiquinone/menaquinone biosynthesis C-methylase UbiE
MSLLLAEKGYDVVGVDGSEEMLTQAQEKKLETDADVIFLCQKMEELDLFGTINAAVSTLDSINHVTDKETVKEIFRRVSLFMEDKGIFLFDVNTPYKHREILGDNTFIYDLDEVYCVWQNSTDEELLTSISLDLFEKDEEDEETYYRYSEEFSERAYELDDIRRWLEECKFEVTAVYEEMTKDSVKADTQRAVFVARKIGTQ